MMKELMKLIKQRMLTSVTSIGNTSSSNSDQFASQACLNLARTYEILNFLDKKETAEPIATINPAEELSDKHWEECRQIALYDDELRQARELLIQTRYFLNTLVMNEQHSPFLKDINDFLAKTDMNKPKEG